MGDIYDDHIPLSREDLKALTEKRREYIEREIEKKEAAKRERKYVVGLAHDGQRMAFVKKARPEWQAGLLNGIGGKVEKNESWDAAMVREFYEETGTYILNWRPLVRMHYPGQAEIFFYTAKVPPLVLQGLYTATDEPIEVHSIEYPSLYPHLFIRNLHWIVPLALHEEEYVAVDVEGYYGNDKSLLGSPQGDPVVAPIKENTTL